MIGEKRCSVVLEIIGIAVAVVLYGENVAREVVVTRRVDRDALGAVVAVVQGIAAAGELALAVDAQAVIVEADGLGFILWHGSDLLLLYAVYAGQAAVLQPEKQIFCDVPALFSIDFCEYIL